MQKFQTLGRQHQDTKDVRQNHGEITRVTSSIDMRAQGCLQQGENI